MRTDLAKQGSARKTKALESIEGNPSLDLKTLRSRLSLQLEVSAAKIIEYVHELNDAGLIVVDSYRAYPAKLFTRLAPEQLT